MMICLSPGGQTITVGQRPSEQLLAGTTDGIFAFVRRNGSWTLRERFLTGEHISSLLYEPRSETLFAGAYAGEYEGAPRSGAGRRPLYASADLGKSWEPRGEGISERNLFTLNLQTLGSQARLYAGTEPAGLYFSDDLGKSWTELPSLRAAPGAERWRFPAWPHLAHVKHVTFDPLNSRVLYASIEVGGLLKSEDGGATWRSLQGIHEDVHRVVLSPFQSERLYLSGLGGVCLSEDGGLTWRNLTAKNFRIGYPDALLLHPMDESLLYVAGSRTNPGQWRTSRIADPSIARSHDGGYSWEIVHDGLPEMIRGNVEAMSMDVWDDGFALYAGTTDGEIFSREDQGSRWTKIAEDLPPISKVGHFRYLGAAVP
jgi:photosystem II stability/assembly factor-like uncharacterized protein